MWKTFEWAAIFVGIAGPAWLFLSVLAGREFWFLRHGERGQSLTVAAIALGFALFVTLIWRPGL